MKKLRLFYNEAKDQAVPFALPALRSYKQNLLFPEELQRKSETSQNPSIEPTENSRTSSNKRSIRSKKPSQHISPSRILTTPLRPMAGNRNLMKNPLVQKNPSNKPSLASRSTEPVRPLRKSNYKEPAVNNNSTQKIQKSPAHNAETPKIAKKTEDSPKVVKGSQPRGATAPRSEIKSPSRSLGNTAESFRNKIKPESAKENGRNFKSASKQHLPMTSIPEKIRSNSISSSKSIRNHLKSPGVNTSNSRVEDQSIPEYPSKQPSRLSAARSLSRKRPKKSKKSSYFDFDPLYFRMSDLSIYPLF